MRALFVCTLVLHVASAPLAFAQGVVDPFAQDETGPDMPLGPGLDEPSHLPDAIAQQAVEAPASAPASPPTLDSLFADLKREASAARAEAIATQIQAQWLRSGSETVDLLLGWAAQAGQSGNPAAAFDLYEQAILLDPGHAGAWNGRATLNFQMERYGRSLADIEQTLQREPRHFGALMGLGAMLEEMGREGEALEAYRRVLTIYPALRPAQDAVARLSSEMRGQSL